MDKKAETAVKLVREARKGSLTSPRSIVCYILALAYIISPVDLIPDTILGPGQLDDAAVLIALIWYIARQLRKMRQK